MPEKQKRKSPIRSADAGVIRADECYTTEALKRRGFTAEDLRLARATGKVRPRKWNGNKFIYLGSELLEHACSLPVKETA